MIHQGKSILRDHMSLVLAQPFYWEELRKDNCDKEIALLILEVVVTLVKCVANVPSKKEEDIQPWLSFHSRYVAHFFHSCTMIFYALKKILTMVLDTMAHECEVWWFP